MFRGEYHNIVDGKGRLSIPAKFRETLSSEHEGSLVITRGLDPCLWLYPGDTWKRNEEQLAKLNPFDSKARALVRGFLSCSVECELDKQGRVVLSPVLRKAVGIEREVVVVGLLNRVEIWDRATYLQMNSQAVGSMDALAQVVSDKDDLPDLTL
jgi:MraZ protein